MRTLITAIIATITFSACSSGASMIPSAQTNGANSTPSTSHISMPMSAAPSEVVGGGLSAAELATTSACRKADLPGGIACANNEATVKPHGDNPCSYLPWVFLGPCAEVTINAQTGSATFAFAAYKGLSTTIQYSGVSLKESELYAIVEATGVGDIKGTFNGVAFPLGNKTFVAYFELVNPSFIGARFANSPAVTIRNSGKWPATTCQIEILTGPVGKEYWYPTGIQGRITQGTLEIPATKGGLGPITPQSAQFFAISC